MWKCWWTILPAIVTVCWQVWTVICEDSAGPTTTEMCNARVMWWHFVHYHTLRISAIPIITFVLMCCTQSSAKGLRAFLPINKTQPVLERPACFCTLLTTHKLWRGHMLRLVLFGVLNSLLGLSSFNKCVGKCTWKNNTYTYVFI
jgi:hypothetical protein